MKANERASNRWIERKSLFIRSRTKEPDSFVPKRKSLSRSFANDLKRTDQNGERTTLSRILQLNGFSHHYKMMPGNPRPLINVKHKSLSDAKSAIYKQTWKD
ncbi:hypothetical protein AVEN_220528-1 [Araneus ventricosus]|uniref:Uncharacterized protein n=1 Tax=Araneus ventricosus TaxID=182803 RepID=A0A4Y2FQP3_ARAVE|nr:hypothetical protein AVEN_220528-1 [Araneus ventricosus]